MSTAQSPFMKLNEVDPPRPTSRAQEPFRALFEEARTSGTHRALKPVISAPVTGGASRPGIAGAPAVREAGRSAVSLHVVGAGQNLAVTNRARVEAEAERLLTVRADHETTARASEVVRHEGVSGTEERATNRVVELIVRELVAELSGPSANARGPLTMSMTPAPVAGATSTTAPEVRAEHAAALIEKIEVFVRSQRPALQLTLNNSLGARVEIERLGPGQIALKLVGQDGPPSADTIGRIRDELRERGLRVAALSIA